MSQEPKPTMEELEKRIGTPDELDIMPNGSVQPKYPELQPPASEFTKEARESIYLCSLCDMRARTADERRLIKVGYSLCARLDRSEASKADLLEALKRAYFLIESKNIKDEYFEVLRLKLGDLLPSQVVSEKTMAAAIAKAK